MAKNRDGGGSSRGMNSKGKTVPFTPPKNLPQLKAAPAPTAKVGKPLKQSAADKAATAKANKNPQFTGKNVPVAKSSSYSLRGMQGSSSFQPTRGQIAKAAAAVLPAGVAKTVLNSYTLGKTVVHGSPEKGLKEIKPRTGSAAKPNENVNFSWNPRGFGDKRRIENYVAEYANKDGRGGSVYVGKVKRSSILKDENPGVTVSNKPIKVKSEIPGNSPRLGEKIESELNKRGVGVPSRVKRAVEQSKPAQAAKKATKKISKRKEMDIA